jgi:putative ABC transport system permease protein
VVQVSALAVGLLALVLLVLLRTDLIASWRRHAARCAQPLRHQRQPEQGDAFQKALKRGGRARYDWYP